MLLVIDNFDSFTYNLVQYFGELGQAQTVVRNNAITVEEALAMDPDRVLISPGPCSPNEAGVSLDIIDAFAGKKPILGVCLGHQSIGQVFGGNVVRADAVMHGKTSPIYHRDEGVFKGLDNPFEATRYHSLVVDRQSLPECLEITAWTQHQDGSMDKIMGMRHREYAIEGVQFHPESILTQYGHELLKNFMEL